jgi:hypothetical protein
MIDSRKLARIRRRVVGSYLSDEGYAVSGKEYFAKVGHQLRYVRFCAAKYGKAFEVHITLHFDFLPPFEFAVWPGAPIPSEMCSELCAFQRLVRNDAGGQYYKYAETEDAAAAMLHDIAVKAAAGLDEVGAICGDGQRLIELIPPGGTLGRSRHLRAAASGQHYRGAESPLSQHANSATGTGGVVPPHHAYFDPTRLFGQILPTRRPNLCIS